MKLTPIIKLFTITITITLANATPPNTQQIQEDLTKILTDIKDNYVYLQDKNIELNCLKQKYSKKISRWTSSMGEGKA